MEELVRKLNAEQVRHNLMCDYAKTLHLLRALKAGEVALDNVAMVGDGWSLAEIPVPSPTPTEG